MSEAEILQKIFRFKNLDDVVVPNGDDAAVVNVNGKLIAFSTDTFVENIHFRSDFSSPSQIGGKIIEASASDIVAMGGLPKWITIGITIPKSHAGKFLEELYDGIYSASERIGAWVHGGDLTSGESLVITVTVIGEVTDRAHLCTRKGAKAGDRLYVTGALGGAATGLKLLERGIAGFEDIKDLHRSPKCRVELMPSLGKLSSAMIDVSDGLSSEAWHLAENSGAKITIDADAVPFRQGVVKACDLLQIQPMEMALSGGEDFELLFTSSETISPELGVCIGKVDSGSGVYFTQNGATLPLPRTGYDHFNSKRINDA